LSHHAFFKSNVQRVRLAAGQRTQAGDATDRPMARSMKRCDDTIRYDTIEEFNVDSKAEYTA